MFTRRRCLGASWAALLTSGVADAQDAFAERRERMAREIERDARETAQYTGRSTLAANVMAAIRKVPRHRFVPAQYEQAAYDNRALPIGEGQTISQPFIVALMTDLAAPEKTHVVLEVGTGSGYQAAVLAACVARVHTIEIVQTLGERAAALLKQLGYSNVETRVGDGYLGWPDAAPFDAVVVTAAPDHVPQPLIDQLRAGGRMVIPVGEQGFGGQDLLVIEKSGDGRTVNRSVLPVRFVPLRRER